MRIPIGLRVENEILQRHCRAVCEKSIGEILLPERISLLESWLPLLLHDSKLKQLAQLGQTTCAAHGRVIAAPYVLLHFLRQLCVCVRAQRGSRFSRRETRTAEDKHAEKRAMQGAFKSAAESELNFTALLTFRFLILLPGNSRILK